MDRANRVDHKASEVPRPLRGCSPKDSEGNQPTSTHLTVYSVFELLSIDDTHDEALSSSIRSERRAIYKSTSTRTRVVRSVSQEEAQVLENVSVFELRIARPEMRTTRRAAVVSRSGEVR